MRLAHVAALGCSAILLSTATAGCSDSTPVPEQGGYTVEFSQGGAMCNIQPHNGDVGTVTATNPSGVATDGVDNASITCTVAGMTTFSVDATASHLGNVLHVNIASISKKNDENNPAKGSASFVYPNTSGNSYSNPSNKPCTFWFDSTSPHQTVDAGQIWAEFACEEVDQGLNKCALTSGVLVFQHCATAVAAQ
jgi:hypothetical protein